MKRISLSILMLLVILQSFLTPIGAFAHSDQSFLLSNEIITDDSSNIGQATVSYDWKFGGNESDAEKNYLFPLPSSITVETDQQGELILSTGQIGSYKITAAGISVNILPGKPEAGGGKLQFTGVKKEAASQPEGGLDAGEGNENEVDSEPSIVDSGNGVTEDTAVPEQTGKEEETDTAAPEQTGEGEETDAAAPEQTEETGEELEENPEGSDTEPQEGSQVIEENILTDSSLSFENQSGDEVEEVDLESLVIVQYEWAIQNDHPYKDGAVFEFRLPEELKVYEPVVNQSLSFGAESVGTFSVDTNGRVKMVFNSFIENHSNIKGTLEVLTSVRESLIITEDRKITVTPIEGKSSHIIPIAFTPKGNTIDKKGISDKGYNAKTIDWSVDLNKHLADIKRAKLTDVIQDGQELQKDSVKIYKLVTKMDGSIEQGEEHKGSEVIADGDNLQVNFGDIASAYRVTYTTNITDTAGTVYHNTAIQSGENTADMEASASVAVKRGEALAKTSTGYNGPTQTITWEIRFNYNEKSIPAGEAVLKDLFNETQDFVDGSLKVEQVTIGDDGKEAGREHVEEGLYSFVKTPAADGKKGFELKFNKDIQEAYKITYQTKAINRVFDTENIKNSIQYGTIIKEANRNIYQQILTKNHGTPDYKNKSISWIIEFNKDSYPMGDVIFTDIFTNEGLTLIEETIKITHGTAVLENGKDFTIGPDFKINFSKQINERVKIEYATEFDYEARKDKGKNYLENKGILEWISDKGESEKKEVITRFTPDNYTQANGFKNGSYNAVTKEITWNVGFNYNLKPIKEAVVTDIIGEGQQLIEDSIVVKEMSLTGGANGVEVKDLKENQDYSIIPNPDGKKGFSIVFSNEISDPYLISYRTSLQGELIKKEYDNTASVYDKDIRITDLYAKVPVTHGGEFTSKSGGQNGKTIDWKVNINYSQSKLSNVKVTDTPTNNQKILKDSFRLFSTTVAEDGKVTKSEEVSQDEYKIDFLELEDGKEQFVLSFNVDIDRPYILEYQSLILAKVGDEVGNDVSLAGEQISEEITKSASKLVVKRTTGMGTGEGVVGSLTVKKVDAADGQVLKGAVFSLIEPASGATIETLTTNEEGSAVFERLLLGEYLLKEDQAPKGYLVGIDGTKQVELRAEDQEIIIENKKVHQAVELLKVDTTDQEKVLAGAKFDLQQKKDDIYQTISSHITNASGQIIVTDLEPGEYQFVETQAPYYYKLDSAPVQFVIEKNQTEMVKVTKGNEPGGPGPDTGTPEEPEDPNNPDPEEPNDPGSPQEPNNPGNPEEPNNPGNPEEPNNPGNPEEPKDPGTPGEPNNPGHPGEPNNPDSPEEPNNPGNPEEPNDPGTPGEPNNPGDPGEPNNPGSPEEPNNPGNPEEPNDPGTPGEPNNPGNSEEPNNPRGPEESNKPGNPNIPEGKNSEKAELNNAGNKNIKGDNYADTLPQTGEAGNQLTNIMGYVLILLGALLLVYRKKEAK
jgi:LPXTG-motif cell wall-anchored protein